jgi:hypothetical protein
MHQIHDRINIYLVTIISCFNLSCASNEPKCLSYKLLIGSNMLQYMGWDGIQPLHEIFKQWNEIYVPFRYVPSIQTE